MELEPKSASGAAFEEVRNDDVPIQTAFDRLGGISCKAGLVPGRKMMPIGKL